MTQYLLKPGDDKTRKISSPCSACPRVFAETATTRDNDRPARRQASGLARRGRTGRRPWPPHYRAVCSPVGARARFYSHRHPRPRHPSTIARRAVVGSWTSPGRTRRVDSTWPTHHRIRHQSTRAGARPPTAKHRLELSSSQSRRNRLLAPVRTEPGCRACPDSLVDDVDVRLEEACTHATIPLHVEAHVVGFTARDNSHYDARLTSPTTVEKLVAERARPGMDRSTATRAVLARAAAEASACSGTTAGFDDTATRPSFSRRLALRAPVLGFTTEEQPALLLMSPAGGCCQPGRGHCRHRTQ